MKISQEDRDNGYSIDLVENLYNGDVFVTLTVGDWQETLASTKCVGCHIAAVAGPLDRLDRNILAANAEYWDADPYIDLEKFNQDFKAGVYKQKEELDSYGF